MRRKGPFRLADSLERLLDSMDSGGRIREALALGYWEAAVGPQAAAATDPECVREGVLIVRTKSSVWSHELTFLKAHIIAQLNRRLGRPVIRDVIFRAQGVAARSAPPLPPAAPSEEELAAIELPDSERHALEVELRALRKTTDPALRESLCRAALRRRKLAHWRLNRGWRACIRCHALHDSEDEVCPVCRVCG